MYNKNVSSILSYMGYIPREDFIVTDYNGVINLEWYSQDIKPTEIEIDTEELLWTRSVALGMVKKASENKRLQYISKLTGKDAEYSFKFKESEDYLATSTIGIYMEERIKLTGESALDVATEWNDKGLAWMRVGGILSGLEDKASLDIESENVSTVCIDIAEGIVSSINNL